MIYSPPRKMDKPHIVTCGRKKLGKHWLYHFSANSEYICGVYLVKYVADKTGAAYLELRGPNWDWPCSTLQEAVLYMMDHCYAQHERVGDRGTCSPTILPDEPIKERKECQ